MFYWCTVSACRRNTEDVEVRVHWIPLEETCQRANVWQVCLMKHFCWKFQQFCAGVDLFLSTFILLVDILLPLSVRICWCGGKLKSILLRIWRISKEAIHYLFFLNYRKNADCFIPGWRDVCKDHKVLEKTLLMSQTADVVLSHRSVCVSKCLKPWNISFFLLCFNEKTTVCI